LDENLAMGELRRDFGDMMGFDLIVTNGIIVCVQFLYFFLSKFTIELKTRGARASALPIKPIFRISAHFGVLKIFPRSWMSCFLASKRSS
jgi:hypothetical protein